MNSKYLFIAALFSASIAQVNRATASVYTTTLSSTVTSDFGQHHDPDRYDAGGPQKAGGGNHHHVVPSFNTSLGDLISAQLVLDITVASDQNSLAGHPTNTQAFSFIHSMTLVAQGKWLNTPGNLAYGTFDEHYSANMVSGMITTDFDMLAEADYTNLFSNGRESIFKSTSPESSRTLSIDGYYYGDFVVTGNIEAMLDVDLLNGDFDPEPEITSEVTVTYQYTTSQAAAVPDPSGIAIAALPLAALVRRRS